jgi:hypothetical protein
MKNFGNPNQPLSNYIALRDTTPEMGPGWLPARPPNRHVPGTPFSNNIPRFGAARPITREASRPPSRCSSPQLHFSRREASPVRKQNSTLNK